MAVEVLCAALADFSPTRVLSSPLTFFFAFPTHNAPCPNTNKTEIGKPSVEC